MDLTSLYLALHLSAAPPAVAMPRFGSAALEQQVESRVARLSARSLPVAPTLLPRPVLAQVEEAGLLENIINAFSRLIDAITGLFSGGDDTSDEGTDTPADAASEDTDTSEVTAAESAAENETAAEPAASEPPEVAPESGESEGESAESVDETETAAEPAASKAPEVATKSDESGDESAPEPTAIEAPPAEVAEVEPSEVEIDRVDEPVSLPVATAAAVRPAKPERDDYADLDLDADTTPPRTISPDIARLNLAATELLDREPIYDPASFEPKTGTTFNPDDSLTLRVLVGNPTERLIAIGDFNNWGDTDNLEPYRLEPLADDPNIHVATLPPDDYHTAQYRLMDEKTGYHRLDLGAALYSTPAFNLRFGGGDRPEQLNSVFWKPGVDPADLAPGIDLRGRQLAIAETDLVSLALKWRCPNPASRFYGETGSEHIIELYSFTRECELADAVADLGYNAIQFMPLDAHLDNWEPNRGYYPIWRYSYVNLSLYAKHADFGSPDELKLMVDSFHRAGVAVVLDTIYSHYSDRGNNPPRDFWGVGFNQYHRADGWELYGGPWTEWGTRRFTYSPEMRQNIVDAALVNVLDYGFDGLRVDNINGIEAQPDGRTFLQELTQAVAAYKPEAAVIGEAYFGDPYLNKAVDAGGAGLLTTYSDRFYLWFTEQIIKYRDEVDTWRLDYMLSNDWPLVMLYYPGNHDEFSNVGSPFQTRGSYLVEAIDGGEHDRKVQSWAALTLFASSYYLDMPQMVTQQPGNLEYNSPVDWARFDDPTVAREAQFLSDMKRYFVAEPAFAPYNMHRHALHWIDHANKVVVFERIDFSTGKRVYAVANLGDREIPDYQIPVYPLDAQFEVALDSGREEYGYSTTDNPARLQARDHRLAFDLPSYGVVALAQVDKFDLGDEERPFVGEERPVLPWYYPYRSESFPEDDGLTQVPF